MDQRPGRFNIGEKTMSIGTEIYRELIKKMLTVHIAATERKMRACQRCPPRCAPLPVQSFIKNPYTAPYRKLPFVPRSHLPTYVQKKLKKPVTQAQETRIRQSAQEAEARLWEAKGDVAMAETELRLRKLDLDARINAMAAGRSGHR